jgi:hypothetical protein
VSYRDLALSAADKAFIDGRAAARAYQSAAERAYTRGIVHGIGVVLAFAAGAGVLLSFL